MGKISVKALSISIGTIWGASMLFVGLTSMSGWGLGLVQVMSSLYIGFKPTFVGSIIGGLWGFLDGLIGGALIAWIYNSSLKN